jgi:hypothetical protein
MAPNSPRSKKGNPVEQCATDLPVVGLFATGLSQKTTQKCSAAIK